MKEPLEPSPILDQRELDLLTDSWERWVNAPITPARQLARKRIYLLFLLVRFAGMMPAELNRFNPFQQIDIQTGLCQALDRHIFLPPQAMRPIRRILHLPQAQNPEFLQIDSGFIRRTFSAIAQCAGLPGEKCTPRALRLARAREMLAMHMPPHIVAKLLGFKNPLQLANIHADFWATTRTNCFPAMITKIETGSSAARISFLVPGDSCLYGIFSFSDVLAMEPEIGRTVTLYVPPGCLIPVEQDANVPNQLRLNILNVTVDNFDLRLTLGSDTFFKLTAVLDRKYFDSADLQKGEKITINISPHMLKLSKLNF